MTSHNLIKVIKRAERERLKQHAAGDVSSDSVARGNSREMAATVREWVGELRQSRLLRYQMSKQQLGWPEVEGSGTVRPAVGAACEGEG